MATTHSGADQDAFVTTVTTYIAHLIQILRGTENVCLVIELLDSHSEPDRPAATVYHAPSQDPPISATAKGKRKEVDEENIVTTRRNRVKLMNVSCNTHQYNHGTMGWTERKRGTVPYLWYNVSGLRRVSPFRIGCMRRISSIPVLNRRQV
ncbi:hypothetical protein B0H19DRAFT_1080145 [Mycena capillaripes]|nr:hypothetical protein B0H19DRAFT_1080145 [Mycena capillaripes]